MTPERYTQMQLGVIIKIRYGLSPPGGGDLVDGQDQSLFTNTVGHDGVHIQGVPGDPETLLDLEKRP